MPASCIPGQLWGQESALTFICRSDPGEAPAAFVRPLARGRSYDVGRTAFQIAGCVACHRINEEGKKLGPDLIELDTSAFTPERLLRSLLEPSAEINETFQSYIFTLDSGEVVTGTIVQETSAAIHVMVDPLNKTDPIAINKAEIEEQYKSSISIMPHGLLNELTHEEILDLIAYIHAKGDPYNPLFHADHQN